MESRSDHVADMRRRLQEACHAEPSATPQQLSRAESVDAWMAAPWLRVPASPGDAGAGREPLVQDTLRRAVKPFGSDLAPMRVEEVAAKVLRLRTLKRQHEEFQEQFSKAEHQLQRMPTHYFLLFQSYLEKHLSEPALAAQLQQPFIQLIKGLAAMCRLDADLGSSEGILACSRLIFRDAHSFANKLIRQQHLSPEESKHLAPCLLSGQKYKRVREKEVNSCFDVISDWLSSSYFHASVSDQVEAVAQELDVQEGLLRQLDDASGAGSNFAATSDAAPLPLLSAGKQMQIQPAASSGMGKGGVASVARQAQRFFPEAANRSSMAERALASLPGPVRRSSASSPTSRSARAGGSPGLAGMPGASRTGGGGVQRMHSDKALTHVLKAIKESRAQSPESSPASRSSGSSLMSCSPARRSSLRQLHGGLSTVPERCVSLPSTLLETLHGPPGKNDDKDHRASKYVPGISRRVTATPKLQ